MFETILIANRGEIACRVMDTARRMGIRTVAVYSDADQNAKHVAMADTAMHIGPSAPTESYLRGDRIIDAALRTGAQAIHPGYGFLSENPDFVDAVKVAGLVFIGPSARAIRAMGLKDAAKTLMQEAGVPVVQGYQGENQEPEYLETEARAIGFPVLIKAVAGGGGKGMRLVERSEEFLEALQAAKGEAKTAFGNEIVLLEKYVPKSRHIEVQVFGDGHRAVHLFERDCSIQRRHQKVIEEAPAPGMKEEMRAAMGQAAVRAAETVGYEGAGTVEFIVDASEGLHPDRFWFMEMNTRLQVEHPVTEAITGVDLVEWQIRVAAGEGLPMEQSQLRIKGHAFEARLYAEDVPKGFLPATGKLTHLTFPEGVRADSGVRAGDEISPYYDPMIAKLITHGGTRSGALRRLASALDKTEVAGVVTNIAFLGALARHRGFADGEVDTGLIARDLDDLVKTDPPRKEDIAVAALAALGLFDREEPETGFVLWLPMERMIRLRRGDETLDIRVQLISVDAHNVIIEGNNIPVRRRGGRWSIAEQTIPKTAVSGDIVTVFAKSGFDFKIVDPLDQDMSLAGDASLVEAPMPGAIKQLLVRAGQAVQEGDRLVVLEAMKMEHALLAGRDGVVAELLVSEGSQVDAKAALIRLKED